MSTKTWAPLVIAIVLGLLAAVVARSSLMRSRAAAEPAKTTSIVVAKAAIPPGHQIAADELTLMAVASKTPPPDTFTSVSDLLDRVTNSPLVVGQPVLGSLLAPKGTPSGLQALVPAGMRAITVDVSESSGLGGLLIPGCHVDVVSTEISQDNADKTISRMIAQNVTVIAVGQRLNGPKQDGERDTPLSRTVTLLVTPHDAEALDLGATAARMRLVLRGNGDTSEADDDGVMMAELRGTSGIPSTALSSQVFGSTAPTQPITPPTPPQPVATTQPAAAPDEPPRRVVTVILGNEERKISFKEDKQATGDKASQVTDDDATKPQ